MSIIQRWIETKAERYLERQGRVVLPRTFSGLAVGYCDVRQTAPGHFQVDMLHPGGKIIALNHSLVDVRI